MLCFSPWHYEVQLELRWEVYYRSGANCLNLTQNYKKDLANERADRTKTEREVIDLIKDMKKKWKADAAKKTEEYDVTINVNLYDFIFFS